jgi:hypothetical protein
MLINELFNSNSEPVIEGAFTNPEQPDSAVASAIIRRILLQRTDLLAKYGPDQVGQAVDDVADFVGDVDEIGSSDVSGWVNMVEEILASMEQGVAEGSSTNAEVTKRAKAAAQKAGKTFNTDVEYRLWYAITTQANAATRKADKKQGVAEGSEDLELYGLRVGDTVKANVNGKRVQGDVIDIFPETQQVELLLRGANAGKTITVDVHDTEYLGEQGVAEGNQEEKIGGRHDADDFDSMVARLKKLAGAGPMKTVWDPDRRVYRNMPTAVQPPQQPKK